MKYAGLMNIIEWLNSSLCTSEHSTRKGISLLHSASRKTLATWGICLMSASDRSPWPMTSDDRCRQSFKLILLYFLLVLHIFRFTTWYRTFCVIFRCVSNYFNLLPLFDPKFDIGFLTSIIHSSEKRASQNSKWNGKNSRYSISKIANLCVQKSRESVSKSGTFTWAWSNLVVEASREFSEFNWNPEGESRACQSFEVGRKNRKEL